MFAERIWRWLGVATVADQIAFNKAQIDHNVAQQRINEADAAQIEILDRRLTVLENKIIFQMTEWAKPPATDAGEPRTVSVTTLTCANIVDDLTQNLPDHLKRDR